MGGAVNNKNNFDGVKEKNKIRKQIMVAKLSKKKKEREKKIEISPLNNKKKFYREEETHLYSSVTKYIRSDSWPYEKELKFVFV